MAIILNQIYQVKSLKKTFKYFGTWMNLLPHQPLFGGYKRANIDWIRKSLEYELISISKILVIWIKLPLSCLNVLLKRRLSFK